MSRLLLCECVGYTSSEVVLEGGDSCEVALRDLACCLCSAVRVSAVSADCVCVVCVHVSSTMCVCLAEHVLCACCVCRVRVSVGRVPARV